jgi:hypothetical protein
VVQTKPRSKRSTARPTGPRFASGAADGSYHTDDSIGSSVKATKSEISTATETVTPN